MGSERPEEPSEEDCCHSGCTNCVFDIYSTALKKWESGQRSDEQFRFDLLSPTRFKPFTLVEVKNLTSDTKLYLFKPQAGMNETINGLLPYSAGQHLSLRINKGGTSDSSLENPGYPYIMRDYSITSLSHLQNDCTFEVLIKLYKDSFSSNFIQNLQIGDVTYWRGPYGDFRHTPARYSNLIMLCIGTGIAPFYPIIKSILSDENDETIIHLLYGCRNSSEIILRYELKELSSYWNFKCSYFLSEEPDLNRKLYNEEFILSRICSSFITDLIKNKENSFFLICGSKSFETDISEILNKLSITGDKMYVF
ncbi:NADH-cytochrome b5 reductase-like [Halyomorpha halys]|uniref:NADH-cytochrome b5 reductase-like n=1 Tax=Halyomorpha halys TaxID=286706 RepID=UPI0006D4FC43|nr:NADH-cytochrome b5 reductase-like [Halyomorpha halys]